eukprot:scaffold2029_cov73-Phaeocystis_antarctica.AAC.4
MGRLSWGWLVAELMNVASTHTSAAAYSHCFISASQSCGEYRVAPALPNAHALSPKLPHVSMSEGAEASSTKSVICFRCGWKLGVDALRILSMARKVCIGTPGGVSSICEPKRCAASFPRRALSLAKKMERLPTKRATQLSSWSRACGSSIEPTLPHLVACEPVLS